MSKILSYKIVEMVLDDANELFAPVWVPSAEKIEILKNYCTAIDELFRDNGGEGFAVEVDEYNQTIKMSMIVSDIEVSRRNDRFNQLVQRAISANIQCTDKEHIKISFVFPSVWERSV